MNLFLLILRRYRLAGQTDHFLEPGISENLYPSIGQQLVTKRLALAVKKYKESGS